MPASSCVRKYRMKKTSKIAKYKGSPETEETEHWNDMEVSIWKFPENFSNQSEIGSGANKDELQSAHIKTVELHYKTLAEHFYLTLKTSGTLKEVNL